MCSIIVSRETVKKGRLVKSAPFFDRKNIVRIPDTVFIGKIPYSRDIVTGV